MFSQSRFLYPYIYEASLVVPFIASFFGTMSFLAAKPITSLGRNLPASWHAAYPNHGRFLQGFLVHEHPWGFAGILFVLLGSAFLMWQTHRIQKQVEGISPARIKIGQRLVFGTWFLMCTVFVLVIIPRLEVAG